MNGAGLFRAAPVGQVVLAVVIPHVGAYGPAIEDRSGLECANLLAAGKRVEGAVVSGTARREPNGIRAARDRGKSRCRNQREKQ
jgi:hypothetical protein